MMHYPADAGQPARTLCGLQDTTLTITWQRRAVACPACIERFDRSLLSLRRFWRRMTHRPTPPTTLRWMDEG